MVIKLYYAELKDASRFEDFKEREFLFNIIAYGFIKEEMDNPSLANLANMSTRLAAAITLKPSLAKARALAAPIPLLAPVTTAYPRSVITQILSQDVRYVMYPCPIN